MAYTLGSIGRSILRRRGLELKYVGAPIRGYANFISSLKERGFAPGTVIDVGVATGTPWLHGHFDKARLVLIEPNPRFEQDLQRMANRWGAVVYQHAVGAAPGQLVLHEDQVAPSSSSHFDLDAGFRAQREQSGTTRTFMDIVVPVKTLDDTLDGSFPGPYLLKIDTEGFERDVLLGATRTLAHTAIVIAEVSVAPRFAGSYSFAELVSLLHERRFRLFDILDVTTLGRGGGINYMDAAFVREDLALELGGSTGRRPR